MRSWSAGWGRSIITTIMSVSIPLYSSMTAIYLMEMNNWYNSTGVCVCVWGGSLSKYHVCHPSYEFTTYIWAIGMIRHGNPHPSKTAFLSSDDINSHYLRFWYTFITGVILPQSWWNYSHPTKTSILVIHSGKWPIDVNLHGAILWHAW